MVDSTSTGSLADAFLASISDHDAARFWARVDRTDADGCWPWTGSRSHSGYGLWSINVSSVRPHRVSYTLTVGRIPDGYEIDHLCYNRICVNPAHLEAITRQQHGKRRLPRPPRLERNGTIQLRHGPQGPRWRVVFRLDGRQLVRVFTTEAEAERFRHLAHTEGTRAAVDQLAASRG